MINRFYPILPDAAWIARLVPLGIKTVQLRMKDVSDDAIRQGVAASLETCKTYGCQLIVNDFWREAIEIGANYVHLGQEDLADADLKAIRAAGIRLGVSTHTPDELEIALRAQPDYVALGPIYETKLKAMRYAPQGLDKIGIWKQQITCPLVAIGGITLERAAGVFAAGADSIAVVTDIVRNEDPGARVSDWLRL